MGTEVPYVRLFVPIVEIDSDREPKVKQWERKRACIKENPDLFDVDTTEEDHEEAARICAGCEVKEQCRKDRMLNPDLAGAAGVFAGWVFTPNAGEAPYSVKDYHLTHKVGGAFRTDKGPRFEKGWTEHRKCKAAEIGCQEEFDVTPSNHTKQFHDKACRIRYNRMIGPDLAESA